MWLQRYIFTIHGSTRLGIAIRNYSIINYGQINPADEKQIWDWSINIQAQTLAYDVSRPRPITALLTCKQVLCFAGMTCKQCCGWWGRLISLRQMQRELKTNAKIVWLLLLLEYEENISFAAKDVLYQKKKLMFFLNLETTVNNYEKQFVITLLLIWWIHVFTT